MWGLAGASRRHAGGFVRKMGNCRLLKYFFACTILFMSNMGKTGFSLTSAGFTQAINFREFSMRKNLCLISVITSIILIFCGCARKTSSIRIGGEPNSSAFSLSGNDLYINPSAFGLNASSIISIDTYSDNSISVNMENQRQSSNSGYESNW